MKTVNKQELSNYIEQNFTEGTRHKIVFDYLNNGYLFVKLNAINGERLYSFSVTHHNKLPKLKMTLQAGKEYYIYEKDINMFSRLSEEEQYKYLQEVTYNGVCIGIIDYKEMQSMLRQLVKKDIEYDIEVVSSSVTDTLWWITSSNMPNGEEIAIWSKQILEGKITVIINDEIKNEKDITFYNASKDIFDKLNSSNTINVIEHRNNEANKYFLQVLVRALVIEEKGLAYKNIFTCNYTGVSGRTLAKLVVSKEVLDDLGTEIRISNGYISSINDFTNKINTLCDALSESKKYYRAADVIKNCINEPVMA